MVQAKHIDPHVHCRDWEESYKATIKSVTELARSQGVVAMFDMPNTKPSLTSSGMVEERLKLAEEEGCLDGYYVYMGATSDPAQIREAVNVVNSNKKVVGIKMFAGRSNMSLAIPEPKAQEAVYKELVKHAYDGVLVVHCEKESLFRADAWNPKVPATWSLARPPEAEIESVKDQISFAKRTGFAGTLHIAHISTPEAVDLVQSAKSSINIVCGATPHHLMYTTANMEAKDGLLYKVNPPLRDQQRVKQLREYLKAGKIDWMETDHAPHTEAEKLHPKDGNYLSGIPSLKLYSTLLSSLESEGFTKDQIQGLTYTNIKKVFKKVVE